MQRHGWTLLFHDCLIAQLQKLHAAVERAHESDPAGFESNANVRFFRSLSQLMQDTIPSDPARDEYRLGNTLGPAFRHWRRARLGRRYRLFFRYDSTAKMIVYAWVNDDRTLRSHPALADTCLHPTVTGDQPNGSITTRPMASRDAIIRNASRKSASGTTACTRGSNRPPRTQSNIVR